MNHTFLEKLREFGFAADFVCRIPEVQVDTDRDIVLARLEPFYIHAVEQMGFQWKHCWRAEQVHGAEVAVVENHNAEIVQGVDGLVTNVPGIALGVYVADCGAVYVVDPVKKAIGIVHSGKKGSELGIVEVAIQKMIEEYGSQPSDLWVTLAPCIRPPAYEVDFAAQIRQSVEKMGVHRFVDCGICTSSDLERYYSYRKEKGNTGRMFAILGIPKEE